MKYGDKIKVMVGFFEGFEGELINQINKGVYEIKVNNNGTETSGMIIIAREEDLQLITTTND